MAAVAPASEYHQWLLDNWYGFIAESYPEEVIDRAQFMALIHRYQDAHWLRQSNRYLGDLWYLFKPDFPRRLDEYYKNQELQLTLTLISYATDPELLYGNYIRPYEIAVGRLGQFSVLEFGSGVPHGLLHTAHRSGASFCTRLDFVDIDSLPPRFLSWFCKGHDVPHTWTRAIAGDAAVVEAGAPFDFIFAKDIFEHLVAPGPVLDQLLARASARAILALDLDDKGAVVYQHVSPALEPLKTRVEDAGFVLIEKTGNLSMYARGGSGSAQAKT
ncbi:MAG: hypothetical protein ABI665_19030 [Vicinamibacterales bacterium]